MNAVDVMALPFEWGSALRHRKLFHPTGVVVSGSIERLAASGVGLPIESAPVVARFSKGVGTPGSLPDIAGLAWRMNQDTGPWDLLTVSVARIPLGRVLLTPLTSWSNATFSTLMPLRYDDGVWWLRARITTSIDDGGLGVDGVSRQVAAGGLRVAVDQAAGTGGFEPLAELDLTALCPDSDITFDPVRNEADHVRLTPTWLTGLRRAAYDRSREGRDAD